MQDEVFLLDTDIVSLFGRPRSPPGLRHWLMELGVHRLAIGYPTITELMRGAHLKRRDDPAKADRIMAWIKRILAASFVAPEMTDEVADVYARMTAEPSLRDMWTVQRAQKTNRLGHDLMIAAVSITHQLPILTANVADFMRIHERFLLPGLYHPMEGRWRLLPTREIAMPQLDKTLPDPSSVHLPKIEDECGQTLDPRGTPSLLGRYRRYIESENIFACRGLRVRPASHSSLVYLARPANSIFEVHQTGVRQLSSLGASVDDGREISVEKS
ncbi:hypothetical protein [Rhizobium sp. 1399]|uniref:hypothetical protein n=1 Tax=Rhizobium sp. 1399 TaxID=2817758 RepID=UPI002857B4C3|nr:hypothetical protein [Rhizobium sp. 1399]MDR6667075.1 putative nucleic acid-binding protein [Rhizobium sp. 1399]